VELFAEAILPQKPEVAYKKALNFQHWKSVGRIHCKKEQLLHKDEQMQSTWASSDQQ
jgi:hypothetical protein